MLEAYQAYCDYDTMAALTVDLVRGTAIAVLGGTVIHRPGGGEVDIGGSWRSATVHEAVSATLEGQATEPACYRDFPVEVSPLARQHRDDPRLAERRDLVVFGAELATGYSGLNDPVEPAEWEWVPTAIRARSGQEAATKRACGHGRAQAMGSARRGVLRYWMRTAPS